MTDVARTGCVLAFCLVCLTVLGLTAGEPVDVSDQWSDDRIADICADVTLDVLADMACERARASDRSIDCSTASPATWLGVES